MSHEKAETLQQLPSRVSFALEPHEGLVKLMLVHDDLADEEAVSLKTWLESGRPLQELRIFAERR